MTVFFRSVLTEWLYCMVCPHYSIRLEGLGYIYANGNSIASEVFAGLTRWQTDRQTTLLGR